MDARKFSIAVSAVLIAGLANGCAVTSVADAAVTVGATAVKVGANVVGATVEVARAGVRAATNAADQKR